MALSMSDWDTLVSPLLQEIEHHAGICSHNARELVHIPLWDTKAEEALERAETIMTAALARIVAARVMMREKKHDS